MVVSLPRRFSQHLLLALLAFAVLSASSAPPEIVFYRTRPLQAARLLVQHDGEFRPVVGASGKRPRIEIDGKKRKAKGDIYTVDLAGIWASGSIKTHDAGTFNVYARTKDVESGVQLGGPWYDGDRFEIRFTPEQSYQDCFLAVVYHSGLNLRRSKSRREPAVYIKNLGDLIETYL